MPNFVKILFGSCLGTLLALGVLFFIGVSIIGGIASSAEEKPTLEANSVLTLDLQNIPELTGNTNPVGGPFDFDPDQVLGVHDLVRVIEDAKENDDVKGIYLNSITVPVPFTTLRTVREALVDFRQSGKFVTAYAPVFDQKSYYLATAAEDIYLGPQGIVDFRGLAAEIPFYKTALDRAGVKMEVFYAGDYKSATEPFRRTEMSPESREQTEEFLNDLFNVMLTDMSTGRNVSEQALRTAAADMTGWKEEQAINAGLVDGILRRTEMDALLHLKLGLDIEDDINFVKAGKYFDAELERLDGGGDNEVAVLMAEGTIINGAGSIGGIGDNKYVNELEKLAEDDDVKAVVLRVNSGGGSASASENIWYAMEQLKEAGKPVVVSMGDYAASGGYYIAAGADRIYAEPTTITGSIGVFLTFPVLKELMNEKIGINFDTVNTARNASAFSPFQGLGEEERKLLNGRAQSTYQIFLERVAEGRNMPISEVREIAGGRVYSGVKAKENGLIDEFGGLDEAIAYATELAQLEADEVSVGHYPRVKPPWEQFLEELIGEGDDTDITTKVLRQQLGAENYERFELMRDMTSGERIQTRLPLVVRF